MEQKKKLETDNGSIAGQLIVNEEAFYSDIVGSYERGHGYDLPANHCMSRSFIPASTGVYRDLSNIGFELPEFNRDRCTGCMECVTLCPDSALMAKVVAEKDVEAEVSCIRDDSLGAFLRSCFAKTKKYYEHAARQGNEGGLFGLFVDPAKCKGCGECAKVCADRGTNALAMVKKTEEKLLLYRRGAAFCANLGPTKESYISEKSLTDMMLRDSSLVYTGGSGSCAGCGEATAIRMVFAATAFYYGGDSIGVIAATGCNTVCCSTYPYSVYRVPWMSSLFENAPAVAVGLRKAWDRRGWQKKRIWVIGGDGAMNDIGFQSLSKLLASGLDVKVLIVDTQVYSNTGGQSSGSSYLSQDTKFSMIGRAQKGKKEARKEIGLIAMMHPDTYVAQTTPAFTNHFYKSVIAANSYPGPAALNVYATCQPEHKVADNLSAVQSRLAVYSRAFPLFTYDPRLGPSFRERISLFGNPSVDHDWYVNPKTGEKLDFIAFAKTEGRFARHFNADGSVSKELEAANAERLANWRRLQELAGVINP